MSTDYITALYLVGGLIVGFLLSSVICLYIIKFISAPKKTAKNPRRKQRVMAEKKTEEEPMPKEEPKASNPIREKLASKNKDSTRADMYCRRHNIDRTAYLRDAMSAQEAGYQYRVDHSTDSFSKGSRYDNVINDASDLNRNTEQTLLEMAMEANRQTMNN